MTGPSASGLLAIARIAWERTLLQIVVTFGITPVRRGYNSHC